MTIDRSQDVERLIEDFMMDHPSPVADDWKCLIDAYPQHASLIADAALFRSGTDDIDGEQGDLSPAGQSAFNNTISKVLNSVHQTPSPLLAAASKRVASIQGPSAKNIAIELGIGPYGSLLSGVLVGRTVAPRRVLEALAHKLQMSAAILAEVFRQSFASSTVPAFKSTEGKPQVSVQPVTWDDAVRAMDVGPEETARLREFAEES
ncbi:MAG: hypothetical protein Q8L44_08770 [Sulfuritalea sp.]|nr:hypothetical protein [Sulfuritalea sp.]